MRENPIAELNLESAHGFFVGRIFRLQSTFEVHISGTVELDSLHHCSSINLQVANFEFPSLICSNGIYTSNLRSTIQYRRSQKKVDYESNKDNVGITYEAAE